MVDEQRRTGAFVGHNPIQDPEGGSDLTGAGILNLGGGVKHTGNAGLTISPALTWDEVREPQHIFISFASPDALLPGATLTATLPATLRPREDHIERGSVTPFTVAPQAASVGTSTEFALQADDELIAGFSWVTPAISTVTSGNTVTITLLDAFPAKTYTVIDLTYLLSGDPATPGDWPVTNSVADPGEEGPVGQFVAFGQDVWLATAAYRVASPSPTASSFFPSLRELESIFVSDAQALLSGGVIDPCTT